jgi:AcrR family transcriptional regulator
MSASKRDELVEKALEVFYREGFHATGMDRLVAVTGISKTSMYKHFRTKEDLILATLKLRHEQFRTLTTKRDLPVGASPKEQLLASFDGLTDWLESDRFQSCMFIKASSEYQDPAHPIHQAAAEHKRALISHMEGLATAAGARAPDVLARQLMLLKEGAIVTAHLQGPVGVGEDAKAAAVILIEAACA